MTKHDDEHELLKDGERIRVPLMLMDSMQRDVRSHFQARMRDSLARHKPGPRYSTDAYANDAREQAYAEYEADLVNRYRAADAWAGKVGDFCTINGASGHLRMVNGKLECIAGNPRDNPAGRRSFAGNEASTDSRDHQTIMDGCYAAYDREITSRWR